MKLGVLTNVVGNMPFEEALKYFKSMGIQMVEIGCGGASERRSEVRGILRPYQEV